ncbi:MAG: glycosyltransferase family 4 protein [Candidatus Helarchaeota archaeon]
MNILLLFPHFNPPTLPSSLRSWQIGRYLAKRGHNVTVFAPGLNMRTEKLFSELKGKIFRKKTTEGVFLIRVRSITNFRKNPLKRILFEFIYGFLVFLRAFFIKKIDIIVSSYPPALVPIFGLLLSKLRNVPVIFEVRDLMADFLDASGYIKLSFFNKLAYKTQNYVARKSDYIITVTYGMKNVFIKRGIEPNKISVVTNGYEDVIFDNYVKSTNNYKQYKWNNKFVVAFSGGLTQIYDIPWLLNIAYKIKNQNDILFAIIGDGNKKKEYIEFCKDKGITNVQFLGSIPRYKIPSVLSKADVGIHYTKNKPIYDVFLCNKIFDYFGSGIPVIYAGKGETAKIIEESRGGIVVEPENEVALISVLKWIKSNPRKAKIMGDNGRRYVKKYYSREKLSKRFEKILVKVVKKDN